MDETGAASGTPQGGNLNPLLSNIFLHYVLDLWFEKRLKRQVRGACFLVRYADDFVCMVQYQDDAQNMLQALRERFTQFDLALHPEKTRVISFGRHERQNAQRQKRRANPFDFLGFSHYGDSSRRGKFIVGRQTSRKKFRTKCQELRARCAGAWAKLTLEERAVRIAAERQERSRPLLDSFHTWLEAEAPKVLPKSPVRAALDYTLANWAALSVYPDDGWLDIDNNEGENSLRGRCLGRRNWLFCGSDRGGRAAAIHFSLLASCKRHGHDPRVYLRDVLTRLPAMLPAASEEELLALLPHRWKPA